MLVLTRKSGQGLSVYQNGEKILNFRLKYVQPNKVKVMIAADDQYVVMRDELFDPEMSNNKKSTQDNNTHYHLTE